MMKHYEMLCVLPGTLAENELALVVQHISQVLDTYAAQQVHVEDMGKSRLGYPVKLIRYGYFQLFRFELETAHVEKMEKSVRLIGGILRVVVQVSDPKKEKAYILATDPTALSAPKKSDEERREGRRFERKSAEKKEQKTVPALTQKKVAQEAPSPVEVYVETTVEASEEPKKEAQSKRFIKKKVDVSLDNIDERLNEILQQDIDKV